MNFRSSISYRNTSMWSLASLSKPEMPVSSYLGNGTRKNQLNKSSISVTQQAVFRTPFKKQSSLL